MKVINDWMVSCGMKKDIKVLKDPITKEPMHPVTFADGVYLNNGTRLEDNIRYLMRKVSVIGDLDKLETNEKRTLVAALNETYRRNGMNTEYGVRFSGSSAEGVRLGDAVDMEASAYYGDIKSYNASDFDRVFPWSDIKRCVIDDNGDILAYENEPGFRTSPSRGSVFVEIPKFYQKIVYDSNVLELWISAYEKPGYWLNPAFTTDEGKELQYIYIGAYEATYEYNVDKERNEIFSRSNKVITGEKTIGELREMAQLKGDFKLIDIYERNLLEFLFCIEYATLNSQTIFAGKNDFSNVILANSNRKTGEVELGLDYPSMNILNTTGDHHTSSFRYRYLENLWGNTGEFTDGVIIKNNDLYVCKLSSSYGKFSNYTKLYNMVTGISHQFISSRFNNADFPYISTPVDGGSNQGSNNQYFCDCVAFPSSDDEKAYIVGYPHTLNSNNQSICSLGNGIFSTHMDINIDERNRDITSRLVYKRQK